MQKININYKHTFVEIKVCGSKNMVRKHQHGGEGVKSYYIEKSFKWFSEFTIVP